MKKLLPLAIAAAMAAPAAAMADATVYGKIHAAYDITDTSINWDDDIDQIYKDTVTRLNSHNSRVGIKGSEDLGNGLKAIYQLEFAVDIAEDGEGGLVKGRNQFVGLAGGFGTVLVGRHDTPLKMSQGKFDLFNDTYADMKRVIPGEDRLGNVGAYVSPDFAGFTFVGAMVAGEEGDADAAIYQGVDPDLTGIADHFSLAGMYNNGPFYGALAYNGYDLGAWDANPSMWRATFVFKTDMFQVGALWSTTDFDISGVSDSDAWGLSGAFNFGSAHSIKAQYLNGDGPVAGIGDQLRVISAATLGVPLGFSPNVNVPLLVEDETTQWTVGYEYGFSKRTSLYALYNSFEIDSIDDEEGTVSLGMVHSF
jgi:predicted porin